MSNPKSPLPPGFRFHPTDEELILHYLRNKAMSLPCPVSIIAEVDIYKFDPWDLPAKAMFGEKEWYFFSPRDRKYPNGVRPNRAAVSGYWKATGTDKPIVASLGEAKIIGVKKALVFYKGRPPKGMKTNWIMHEYRLSQSHKPKPIKSRDSSMRLDEWVLCRIYKKSTAAAIEQEQEQEQELEHSLKQEDPFSNIQNLHTINPQKSLSFSDFLDVTDYSDLIGFEQNPMLHTNANYNNNIISSDNNNYLLQSPQQMDPNSISFVENQLKRTRSLSLNAEEPMLKKVMNTCNFTNNTSQMEDTPQYNSLYQPFLNQQLLMSSHYQL